jgi:hypothetical protein
LTHYRPLPGSLLTDRYDPFFQDSRLKPLLDQADDAPVADAMIQDDSESGRAIIDCGNGCVS